MHHAEFEARPESSELSTGPWYQGMTRYHWFVMVVAALGWLFDCLDQQLFVLARPAAMRELLPKGVKNTAAVDEALAALELQAPAQFAAETKELSKTLKSPEISDEAGYLKLLDALPAKIKSVESSEQFAAFKEKTKKDLELTTLNKAIETYSGYATTVFLLGWGIGGLFFGVLGDRIGRAKTMLITILLYSAFTGLSAISQHFWDFAFYRFLTGLGVGGEFAVGVALVAEVMPNRARTWCLTLLQMLSAFGNITAAAIGGSFGILESEGLLDSPWRKMFIIGALPALLALVIRAKLREPEKWQQAQHSDALKKQFGSYRELFGHPVWRRHAFLGLMLGFSGVVGLWGIGFFLPDLTGRVLKPKTEADVFTAQIAAATDQANPERAGQLTELQSLMRAKSPIPPELKDLKGEIDKAIRGRSAVLGAISSFCLNVGAFCGMFGFGFISQRIGRRPTFALAFLAAGISTAAVFWCLRDFSQIFWMGPIMGFCQLSLFAGFAIYFPELFPTHLRSTGTSFCYNVGRIVAALGPTILSQLNLFYAGRGWGDDSFRIAAVTMCSVFLLGILALPFAPETKGKPLPE